MECLIKKPVLQGKLYRQENLMLKWLRHGCSEFSEQLGIINCTGNFFSMEKMAFLPMPNLYFHDEQISWNNTFSVSSQGVSLTIITF